MSTASYGLFNYGVHANITEDGFYTDEASGDGSGPRHKQRVLKKIPQSVVANAVGLAVFTTMRTGLWISGAGGSGILVARQANGSWSPPSGIMLHTAGLGFLVGVDIYDCVLVINNRKALDAFCKLRATVGGEISAVAGPMGVGGIVENDGKWKQANRPVFTYLKSRGFYAGVQIDGTIVIERTDENERFYGEKIGVAGILTGKVQHPPTAELRMLMETLKLAEGRTDVDETLMDELDGQPAPADVNVDAPGSGCGGSGAEELFGIPRPEDPDPYGVLALEKEGLEVREAATQSRPSSQQFEFHPSPTSPIYGRFHRQSVSSHHRWSSDRSYSSVDAETQTKPVVILPMEASGDTTDETSVYEDVLEGEDENRLMGEHHMPRGLENPWDSEEESKKNDFKNTEVSSGDKNQESLPELPPRR